MSSYFCRYTPRKPEETTLDDMEAFIRELTDEFVISYEHLPRNDHFHICLWKVKRSPENLRYHLKTHLVGQVYISGKEIEDKVKAIAYTIKDGSYRSSGIDVFTWMSAMRTTHKKVKFDDDVKELTERYDPQLYNDEWLAGGIIEIYRKHNRKIYVQHLRALLQTIKMHKDSNYKLQLIDKIVGYD